MNTEGRREKLLRGLLFCLLFCLPLNAGAAELIIFTAEWCAPCQQFKKNLTDDPAIVEGYDWGFIDFDKEKELAEFHAVKNVPTFLILERNNVVARQTGYQGAEKLKNWLQRHQNKRSRTNHGEQQKNIRTSVERDAATTRFFTASRYRSNTYQYKTNYACEHYCRVSWCCWWCSKFGFRR